MILYESGGGSIKGLGLRLKGHPRLTAPARPLSISGMERCHRLECLGFAGGLRAAQCTVSRSIVGPLGVKL
jgi:hypothetical protein